jgi:hypothetical protein
MDKGIFSLPSSKLKTYWESGEMMLEQLLKRERNRQQFPKHISPYLTLRPKDLPWKQSAWQ